MKIINDGGFGVEERKTWKNIIFNNLVDAFLYLFKLMETQDTELQYTNNSVRWLHSPRGSYAVLILPVETSLPP
jgi:hypothetical protein